MVLIKLQMPDALWVEGRNGWQRRGRRVARGTSGIRIVASADAVDRRVGVLQGHGVATVWDVSQTDGPLVARPPVATSADLQPKDAFGALLQVAAAAGYNVKEERTATGGAETDHRRKRILVADDPDDPVAVLSLAHELAHLRMHKLSRDAGCHGLARLEATSVAYAVVARYGLVPGGPSHDLITSATATIGRAPSVRLVETLGGRVVVAAERLISATERHLPTPRTLLTRTPTMSISPDGDAPALGPAL
ncbi:hypothetical protein OHB24_21395 [Kribbella sp. NBC_00482]|uniref:hypothetical protein n=1 Tax=Kribbella sp. NBC_00482 TaxID=2975968 RepID=UPI002E179E65